MKMEPTVSSETLAIRTQTLGNYPKRNTLHFLTFCWIIVPHIQDQAVQGEVKVRWSHYRPGVAQRVSRGMVVLFHDCGTRMGSASRPGRTLPPGKTRYPFYMRLGGPLGWSGRVENLVPTGIRSRTVQPVVSRYTDWATWPTAQREINPLNNNLNPIWHFMALLAHHILHISRVSVKVFTDKALWKTVTINLPSKVASHLRSPEFSSLWQSQTLHTTLSQY